MLTVVPDIIHQFTMFKDARKHKVISEGAYLSNIFCIISPSLHFYLRSLKKYIMTSLNSGNLYQSLNGKLIETLK